MLDNNLFRRLPDRFSPILCSLLILLILISAECRADTVILKSGMQYHDVAVIGFNSGPEGDVFMVRTIEPGHQMFADHPIEAERIREIIFNNPEESAATDSYRTANLRLLSGEVLQEIPFRSFATDESDATFQIKKTQNSLPGQTSIPASTVDEMMFRNPQALQPLSISAAPAILETPASPTPTPTPVAEEVEIIEFNTDQSLGTQLFGEEDYPLDNVDGDWGALGDSDYWGEEDSSYWTSADEGSYYEDSEYFSGVQDRSSEVGVEMFGMAAGVIDLLIYLFISSLTGGIYLYISSRIEGVLDFPIWKSFVAAAALAIFPWAFFYACARFIPIFGLWVGLVALYFTARMIIMGALEVMEEKATSVLFTFVVVQLLVLFMVFRYL